MNDEIMLSVVRDRLSEVRDALGDVHTNIRASEIVARARRRRTRRVLAAAGVACAAVAAGIAVPLAAGTGSQPAAAGAVIRLASHTFRMPAGYWLTAATRPPCHAVAFFALPSSLVPPHAKGTPFQSRPYGAGMKAAASSSGGCILLVLAPRYTPTAAIPDPQAPAAAHLVRVGRCRGRIFHFPFVSVSKTGLRSSVTELFVQLPSGGGQVRDLVIGAKGLSDSTLIQIAAQGLSSGQVARW